jgi:hypothetical protein
MYRRDAICCQHPYALLHLLSLYGDPSLVLDHAVERNPLLEHRIWRENFGFVCIGGGWWQISVDSGS